MFSTQCLRSLSRVSTPLISKSLSSPLRRSPPKPIPSSRPFSILTPKRPTLSISFPSSTTSVPTSCTGHELDLLPKISAHPALAGIQVRNGPRRTFDPSHRVRKRRHGFLSRVKGGRKGHATLKRRRVKGRSTLSH